MSDANPLSMSPVGNGIQEISIWIARANFFPCECWWNKWQPCQLFPYLCASPILFQGLMQEMFGAIGFWGLCEDWERSETVPKNLKTQCIILCRLTWEQVPLNSRKFASERTCIGLGVRNQNKIWTAKEVCFKTILTNCLSPTFCIFRNLKHRSLFYPIIIPQFCSTSVPRVLIHTYTVGWECKGQGEADAYKLAERICIPHCSKSASQVCDCLSNGDGLPFPEQKLFYMQLEERKRAQRLGRGGEKQYTG